MREQNGEEKNAKKANKNVYFDHKARFLWLGLLLQWSEGFKEKFGAILKRQTTRLFGEDCQVVKVFCGD